MTISGEKRYITLCYKTYPDLQRFMRDFIRKYGIFPESVELAMRDADFAVEGDVDARNPDSLGRDSLGLLMALLVQSNDESSYHLSQKFTASVFESAPLRHPEVQILAENTQVITSLETAVRKSGVSREWCDTFLKFPEKGVPYFVDLAKCEAGKEIAVQLTDLALAPVFSDVMNLFYVRDVLAFLYFSDLLSQSSSYLVDKVLYRRNPPEGHTKAFSPRCTWEFFRRCGSFEQDAKLHHRRTTDDQKLDSVQAVLRQLKFIRGNKTNRLVGNAPVIPPYTNASSKPLLPDLYTMAVLVTGEKNPASSMLSNAFVCSLVDMSGKSNFYPARLQRYRSAATTSSVIVIPPLYERDRVDFKTSIARDLPADYFMEITPATSELVAYACSSQVDDQLAGRLLKQGTRDRLPVSVYAQLRRVVFIANAFLGTGLGRTKYDANEMDLLGIPINKRMHHRSIRFPEALMLLRKYPQSLPGGFGDDVLIDHLGELETQFHLIQEEWERVVYLSRFRVMKLALFSYARQMCFTGNVVRPHDFLDQSLNFGAVSFYKYQLLSDLCLPEHGRDWLEFIKNDLSSWEARNPCAQPGFLDNIDPKLTRREILSRVHVLCAYSKFSTRPEAINERLGQQLTINSNLPVFNTYIKHAAGGRQPLIIAHPSIELAVATQVRDSLKKTEWPDFFLYATYGTHQVVADQRNDHKSYLDWSGGLTYDALSKGEVGKVQTVSTKYYVRDVFSGRKATEAWRLFFAPDPNQRIVTCICDLQYPGPAATSDHTLESMGRDAEPTIRNVDFLVIVCNGPCTLRPFEVDAVCQWIAKYAAPTHAQFFLFSAGTELEDKQGWIDAISTPGRLLIDDPRFNAPAARARYEQLPEIMVNLPIPPDFIELSNRQ